MNDYKELITELRKCKYCAPNIAKYSADAIEQLVKERYEWMQLHSEVCAKAESDIEQFRKERNMAVGDHEKLRLCYTCKYAKSKKYDICWCNYLNGWISCHDSCVEWEWRGVQKADND